MYYEIVHSGTLYFGDLGGSVLSQRTKLGRPLDLTITIV